MKVQTVWQVVGHTESWDEFSYTFAYKPTEEDVLAFLYHNGWKEEFTEVGFVIYRIEKTTIITSFPTEEEKQAIQEYIGK